jgi:hypothetical protein
MSWFLLFGLIKAISLIPISWFTSLLIIAYTYLSFSFSSMLPLKTWNQGMSLMRVLAQFVIGNFGCFEIAIGL